MINPVQFLFLVGGSFLGTFGFIITFWLAGIVRTNIVWFISVLSMSVEPGIIPNIDGSSEVPSANIVNHRSSSVRSSPAIKLQGTLSSSLPVRPVAKIYSDADRKRTRDSIRVCRIDSTPEMIDAESFSPATIVELRYEPSAVPVSIVNPETVPTSDIFGP